MGIFSRRPKIPDPTITCAYIDRSTNDYYSGTSVPYQPGSPVTGVINFNCPAQRQVRSINLSFHGKCITHSTRTENAGNNQTRVVHYHDDVDLFRNVEDLMAGRATFLTEGNQDLSWNFDFIFPQTCMVTRDDPYERIGAGTDVYDVGVHYLPPSFHLENGGHSKIASVVYQLEIEILMDDNPEPFVVQFDPLPFAPPPPTMPPNVQPPFAEFVRKAEKYSSSRLMGAEKSFRASIRDKFSSSTPSMEVTMKASLVPLITLGKPFELFVCVELAKLSHAKGIFVPSVVFSVKKLRLYEDTVFRALRVHGSRVPEHEKIDTVHTSLSTAPESAVVDQQPAPPPTYQAPPPVQDSKGGASEKRRGSSSSSSDDDAAMPSAPELVFPTSFESSIPANVVPSFRTVNINHSFQLEVEVEVVIAEKKFEHHFDVPNVTVLPSKPGTTV